MSEGWFSSLKTGLSRTTSRLTSGIAQAVSGRKLDKKALQALEETLITADLGVTTAAKLISSLEAEKFDRDVTEKEVREHLAFRLKNILEPVAIPLQPQGENKPHVILVVGVNGCGKTTTIGKLAKAYVGEGKSVVLAAGDTFRAAAVEQLKIWGERTGCPTVAKDTGSDAAGVAFEALELARKNGADVLLIDTAGRLQNREDLMAEVQKMIRVLRKIDQTAPHSCLLVLDATVGQNANSQVETFKKIAEVSGIVMTKLDGTARGGVLVAVAEKYGLPVHAIGVGEGEDDLRPFSAKDFSEGLMGLSKEN